MEQAFEVVKTEIVKLFCDVCGEEVTEYTFDEKVCTKNRDSMNTPEPYVYRCNKCGWKHRSAFSYPYTTQTLGMRTR